jgi:hypothetical protein
MRRIAPLAAVLAVPLLSCLTGCDDSRPPAARETVALGTLPAEPSASTRAPAPTSTDPVTTEQAAETVETAETVDTVDTVDTADTEPATTEAAPAPSPTRFVEELDGLVEDDAPDALATTPLRDDTGRLRLAAPTAWSARRTQPSRLDDGDETPSLAASPDLTAFLDSYDAPGLTALVVPDEPADALGAYEFGEDCLSGGDGDYEGGAGAGRYQVWESCGGTLNDIVTVAVRPDGADATVLLLVQVVDAADLAALDAALDSLTLRR